MLFPCRFLDPKDFYLTIPPFSVDDEVADPLPAYLIFYSCKQHQIYS